MIDITSKEGLGDKEQMPGLREYTASCEGWVEQVANNKLEFSQKFDEAVWDGSVGTTVNSVTETAPDASATAAEVEFTTEYSQPSADSLVQNNTTSRASGTVLIFSVWIKTATSTQAVIGINDNTNNNGTNITIDAVS